MILFSPCLAQAYSSFAQVPLLQGRLSVCCLVSPCITLPTPCLCYFGPRWLRLVLVFSPFCSGWKICVKAQHFLPLSAPSAFFARFSSLSSLLSSVSGRSVSRHSASLTLCSFCLICFPGRRDLCSGTAPVSLGCFLLSTLPRCPLC